MIQHPLVIQQYAMVRNRLDIAHAVGVLRPKIDIPITLLYSSFIPFWPT
jgi:hypothetical protein